MHPKAIKFFQSCKLYLTSFGFLADMRGGGSEFETGKSNLPAESELELGLGLSIGGGAWRERGRILTAKDFPSVGSKRAADSSSHQGQGSSPPRSRFRLFYLFIYQESSNLLVLLLSRNRIYLRNLLASVIVYSESDFVIYSKCCKSDELSSFLSCY